MRARVGGVLAAPVRRIAGFARRPELLAFLPAATLGAFWLGGEGALVLTALVVPLVYALAGILGGDGEGRAPRPVDGTTGLPLRASAVAALDEALDIARDGRATTACIVLGIDEADVVLERNGHAAWARILRRTGERLQGAVRAGDTVARLDGAVFAVALAPVRRADLEALIQISGRLQATVAEPLSIDAGAVHVTASVGFCLAGRAPAGDGAALLEAAEAALAEALRNGPGAIRAFTPEMARTRTERRALRAGIGEALDSGAIRPWFQPQVSTDTGAVTGFEALVRWIHPERGVLPPAEFLAAVHAEGLSERMGEIVLYGALRALQSWDAAGLDIPSVSVNLSPEELRNPRLAERIAWELDRFDIAPERVTFEILETVVARSHHDVVTQTIAGLARLGCRIDLDDFGTGQASIAAIRRFGVRRIKIDRSFVARVDTDREQQRVVTAILSMAERLGLETLAEGVETPAEHAMLAQLGCGFVQGFAIARPMPPDDVAGWTMAWRARIAGSGDGAGALPRAAAGGRRPKPAG